MNESNEVLHLEDRVKLAYSHVFHGRVARLVHLMSSNCTGSPDRLDKWLEDTNRRMTLQASLGVFDIDPASLSLGDLSIDLTPDRRHATVEATIRAAGSDLGRNWVPTEWQIEDGEWVIAQCEFPISDYSLWEGPPLRNRTLDSEPLEPLGLGEPNYTLAEDQKLDWRVELTNTYEDRGYAYDVEVVIEALAEDGRRVGTGSQIVDTLDAGSTVEVVGEFSVSEEPSDVRATYIFHGDFGY